MQKQKIREWFWRLWSAVSSLSAAARAEKHRATDRFTDYYYRQ